MTKQKLGATVQSWFLILLLSYCASVSFGQETAPASNNFDNVVRSATDAREAGRATEAIQNYQRAVELRPDWAEGWWYLGSLLYDGNRFVDAQKRFQKLVQLVPSMGAAWNFLGLCEYETRDFANSRAHLEKGQELGATDDPEVAPVAAYHLALLRIKNGEFEHASALLVSSFPETRKPDQVKAALGLAMLRVPLLPSEVDPSQDALIHAAGEAASVVANGDAVKVQELLGDLFKTNPNTPYLHYAYGVVLRKAGKINQALEQQQLEIKLSPKSALPLIEIAALDLQRKNLVDARRAAEQAIRLAPRSSAAHRVLGQCLQSLGKKEEAAREFKTADALAPDEPQPDATVARLYANRSSQPATVNAESASGPEWENAMRPYSAGEYTEAISRLKSWVQSNPNDGTAWAVLGLSEFEMKDYRNAFIHLQRGRELGFGGSTAAVQLANYRLAILLNQSKQFERASALLGASSDSGPLSKDMQFARGMALLRIPLLPDQVTNSQKSVVQTAGETAELLQTSKYDQAFANFDAMLKQAPDMPFLHYAYGTALIALSRYEEAEAQMRAELRISSNSELPYIRLASIAVRQHRPADALGPSQQALTLAPESGEAHYLLGRAHLEMGQQEAALRELEIASKIAPNSPEIHFNLAKAYTRAKLPEKAEQEREIFVRLNALAEHQRGHSGIQSYEGPREAIDLPAASDATNGTAAPH